METYCNQCKKNMSINNFDMKNEGDYYTRCKSCRTNHNQKNKESYTSTKKKFSDYDGLTSLGKKKVDCWSIVNELKPCDAYMSTHKKAWFKCDKCPHEFESTLNNITGGRWCPYCSNHKMCNKDDCQHCYNNSFASYDGLTSLGQKKVDCWSYVNDKKPHEVSISNGNKFWFTCDKCPHDFEIRISDITKKKGNWCSYCSNHKLCNKEDCQHCYNNSFASYDGKTSLGKSKVDCWSDKNNKTPRDLSICNDKKYWFNCDKCPHEFESALSHITAGKWCPYCVNLKRCDKEDCNHCFKNSFASCDKKTPSGKNNIVDCWSDKNNKTPRDLTMHCNKKFWFKCDKCPHEFESALNNITAGKWCPYCSVPVRRMCNKDDCNHCFNKSFASYDGKTSLGKKKVDCWSMKNKLNSRDVAMQCNKKFWFKCDKCPHEFESALSSIKRGGWCPHCKNKTELKLHNYLLQQNNIKEVKREYNPKWCSTEYTYIVKDKLKQGKYQYRFDFLITLKNKKQIIIELDGRQHYEQVSDWKTPLEQQIRDKYKEFKAKKNKIPLIRCIQEDVFTDRNDWKIKLENLLQQYH